MNKRPLIGVTESRSGRPFMPFFNWLSLRLVGARSKRLAAPLDPTDLDQIDGLLVGGGEDIGFDLYGGIPTPTEKIDPERDQMELQALERASARRLPILGVCRGAQMLNVFYGGNLHADIFGTFPIPPNERTVFPTKPVTIAEQESVLRRATRASRVNVNRLHHQAVDRLGENFVDVAKDQYGITQAIEKPGTVFCVGVQWHPEFLFYHPAHRRLMAAFVDAVKENRGTENSVDEH